MLPAHRLGVYWGTIYVPVKYTYIKSAEGGCNWLLSADLKCGRFSFVRHRCRRYGIRLLKPGSAAQRKGCSACFVLVLVGIVMWTVQENRRTMSQFLKPSDWALALRDRGGRKDEKYSGWNGSGGKCCKTIRCYYLKLSFWNGFPNNTVFYNALIYNVLYVWGSVYLPTLDMLMCW